MVSTKKCGPQIPQPRIIHTPKRTEPSHKVCTQWFPAGLCSDPPWPHLKAMGKGSQHNPQGFSISTWKSDCQPQVDSTPGSLIASAWAAGPHLNKVKGGDTGMRLDHPCSNPPTCVSGVVLDAWIGLWNIVWWIWDVCFTMVWLKFKVQTTVGRQWCMYT